MAVTREPRADTAPRPLSRHAARVRDEQQLFRSLRSLPVVTRLSAAEEGTLIRVANGPDAKCADEAKTRLLAAHRAYLWKRVRPYVGIRRAQATDLWQAATEGFLAAITRYDPAGGALLATYADYYIRGTIRQLLAKERPRVEEQAALLSQPAGEPDHLECLSDQIPSDAVSGFDTARRDRSDSSCPTAHQITARAKMLSRAGRLLSALPKQDAEVLRLRYGVGSDGDGLNQDAVGQLLGGITKQAVSKIEIHALARLRTQAQRHGWTARNTLPHSGKKRQPTPGSANAYRFEFRWEVEQERRYFREAGRLVLGRDTHNNERGFVYGAGGGLAPGTPSRFPINPDARRMTPP